MSEAGGGGPFEDAAPDDPFLAEDPAALERERRRREREARRREREARRQERETGRPEGGATPRQRREGPGIGARVRGALSGLAARRRRRFGRAGAGDAAPAEPPAVAADPPATPVDPPATIADSPAAATEPPPATAERRTATGVGGRRIWRSPLAWVAILLLLALAWFLVALFQPFAGDGDGEVVVTIPRNASAGEIADLLDEEGVISSATLFEIRLTLAGRRSDLFAGTYTLAEGMSYSAAIDALSTPPSQRSITISIPEGYSREQIAALVTDAGVDGSYERASDDPGNFPLDKYGAKGDSLEGFLFPATYELKRKEDASDLVREQLAAFERSFKRVDMDHPESKNLSPYDVLIIASMIDREVMVAKERDLVAAVIYNRLDQGEPLAIDATTRYALGNYDQPLTESELAIDSPYNTRTQAGLPPTPIGNPGLAAIKAAADPADVDYLFYVVKPGTCGKHVFTTTLEEHEAAVARYEDARAAAGGKSPTEC